MKMRWQIIAAGKEATACRTAVDSDPLFAPLWIHTPIPPTAPTMDQLADNGFPNAEETQLIKSWHERMAPCRERALEKLQNIDGRFALVFSAHYNSADLILLDLIAHKKTWGQANQSFQAEQLSGKRQLVALAGTIDTELRLQNQEELEQQREAAVTTAQTFATIEQGIAAANAARKASQPVVTTCNQVAFNTTCVSQ